MEWIGTSDFISEILHQKWKWVMEPTVLLSFSNRLVDEKRQVTPFFMLRGLDSDVEHEKPYSSREKTDH